MDGKTSQRKVETLLMASEARCTEMQHLLLKVEELLAAVDRARRRQARSMVRRKRK
jgi:hypothetical protein